MVVDFQSRDIRFNPQYGLFAQAPVAAARLEYRTTALGTPTDRQTILQLCK